MTSALEVMAAQRFGVVAGRQVVAAMQRRRFPARLVRRAQQHQAAGLSLGQRWRARTALRDADLLADLMRTGAEATASAAARLEAKVVGAAAIGLSGAELVEALRAELVAALELPEGLAVVDHHVRSTHTEVLALRSHVEALDTGLRDLNRGASPAAARRLVSLPPMAGQLIGRDAELSAVASAWSAEPARPAVTHGLAGIGKSVLAARAAADLAEQAGAPAVIWWLDASSSESARAGLASLGHALSPDAPDPVQAAVDWLAASRDWAVVADGVPDDGALRQALPFAPRGRLLCTSTNPTWPSNYERLPLDLLDDEASGALLRQDLPDLDGATVRGIVAELRRLPLALAQANHFLRHTRMPAEQYLQMLRDRLADALGRGRAMHEPATVLATVELALERLNASSDLAPLLCASAAACGETRIPLRVFVAGFCTAVAAFKPLEAEDVWEAVGAVSALGLCQQDGESMRMHRLTGAAIRHLMESEDPDRWVSIATQAAIALAVGSSPCDAATASATAPSLFAALDRLPSSDWGTAFLTGRYAALLGVASQARDAVTACRRTREFAAPWLLLFGLDGADSEGQRPGPADEEQGGIERWQAEQVLRQLDTTEALALADLGLADAAVPLARRAVALAPPDDPADQARAHNNLALALHRAGHADEAGEHAALALELDTQAQSSPVVVARRLIHLGQSAMATGDTAGAREYFDQAEVIAKTAAEDVPEARWAAAHAAAMRLQTGPPGAQHDDEALALRERELAAGRDAGVGARLIAVLTHNLATSYKMRGRDDLAVALLRESLDIALDLWGPRHAEVACRHRSLGWALAHTAPDEAQLELSRARDAIDHDDPAYAAEQARIECYLVEVLDAQGDDSGARAARTRLAALLETAPLQGVDADEAADLRAVARGTTP